MAGERAEYSISQTLDERLIRLAKRRDQIAGLVARGVLDPIHLEREDELVASLKVPSPLAAVSPLVIETVPVEGIAEIWGFLNDLVSETEEELPDSSVLDFYRFLADKIPYHIPLEKQEQARWAISSSDSDTARTGRETLVLFSLGTILNALEPFLPHSEEGDNEVVQAAFESAMMRLKRLGSEVPIRQQIHQAVTHGVARSIARREKVPIRWVLAGKHRTAVSLVNEIFRQHPYGLNKAEIDAFSAAIGSQPGLSAGSAKVYLRYRNFLISDQKTAGGIEGAEDRLMLADLEEEVGDVLDTLTGRERLVLGFRFGLRGGKEHTLEEVGSEFGVTDERIRQIEAKALRRLRDPVRSRRFGDYR